MIKAIIFDCFGVLTKDRWREFCDSLPPGPKVEEARKLNHQYDSGLLNLDQFVDAVVRLTGADRELLEDIFTKQDGYKNLELIRYIERLKPSYKIGILSNVASNWLKDTFLTPQELLLFDSIVLSHEAGATKPDPKMYQAVLKELGVKAQDAVFIDDVERYCDAARGVGMQAILYKDFAQMKQELEELLSE